MNIKTIIMLCFLAAVIVFIIIYFVIKKIKNANAVKIGKNGEKLVSKELSRIAKKYHFLVINDLYLPLYDKTTQIDHVVIGTFGAMAIETKAVGGEVYGNEKDKEWVSVLGDKRSEKRNKFYNPLLQNKTHIDCILHTLRGENVYKVNVDSLVVFTGRKTILNIPRGLPVISLSLLKKYFKKPRYKADNGIDPQKVYDALIKNAVTDKALLKKHNSNVKKMSKGN